MMKSLFAVCLGLSSALAFGQQAASDQNQTKAQAKAQVEAALSRAGCGASDVRFDVTTDKMQHPTAQPDAGKALVYVFEVDETGGAGPTTRVGLDSKWMGANQHQAYFFFPVDPGEHRLCIMENTNGASKFGAALHFTAKAGKTYYFQGTVTGLRIDLQMVNFAQGDFLISSATLSTFKVKPASPPDQGGFQPEP